MTMQRFNSDNAPKHNGAFGNNFFTLTYMDDANEPHSLAGLLKELPSFGLSTDWMEAPIAAAGKKIQEFFMSDMIECCAALSSANYSNQLLTDKWSSRMFAGTKNKEMDLNFRIYTENPLGQSSPFEWYSTLVKYATVSSSSTTSLQGLVNNIGIALHAIEGEGENAGGTATFQQRAAQFPPHRNQEFIG